MAIFTMIGKLRGYVGAQPDTSTYAIGNRARKASAYPSSGMVPIFWTGEVNKDRTHPVGNMRREVWTENQGVRVKARKVKIGGAGGVGKSDLTNHGVLGRIQDGTWVASGNSAAGTVSQLTCYAFGITSADSGATHVFKLIRYNAGTPTVLATSLSASLPSQVFTQDFVMELFCATLSNGNVRLLATVSGITLPSTFDPNLQVPGAIGGAGTLAGRQGVGKVPFGDGPISVIGPAPGISTLPYLDTIEGGTIFDIVDTDGSKITGEGRAGFMSDGELDINGTEVATVVTEFTVIQLNDPNDPTFQDADVIFDDTFERYAGIYCWDLTDQFGNLAIETPDYAWDIHSDAVMVGTGGALGWASDEEAIEVSTSAIDMGLAVDLNTTASRVEIDTGVYGPEIASTAGSLEFSISAWGRLVNINDKAGLYSLDASNEFWLGVGTGDNMSFNVLAGGVTATSAEFDAGPYENDIWKWTVTYKAIGSGCRARLYFGRNGAATQVAEIVTASDRLDGWIGTTHKFGNRDNDGDSFEGQLDELLVFNRELTAAEVGVTSDLFFNPAQYTADYDLNAGFHFDESGPTYTAFASTGDIGATATRVSGTVDTGIVPVYQPTLVAFTQFTFDEQQQHEVQVDYRPRTVSSMGGCAVRVSVQPGVIGDPDITDWQGYAMLVSPGSPATINLYRVLGGLKTLIGVNAGATAITLDAYNSLTLTASQTEEGGTAGPVVLSATVGGADVTFSAVGTGVGLGLSGELIDNHTNRILSGSTMAMVAERDGTAHRFDNFSVVVPEVVNTPTAFASYDLPGEADGAVGDLASVLLVDWQIVRRLLTGHRQHTFESGHQSRFTLDPYTRRRYSLRKVGASDAEIAALRTFWDDHNGPELAFTFDLSAIKPGEISGKFKFVLDSLRDGHVNNTRVTEFEIMEAVDVGS